MLFFIILNYFLLNSLSVSARSPCSLFNRKLNQYLTPAQLDSSKQSKIANRTFCHGLINNHLCCPSKYEENIQNATAIELHQLFQIHSRRLSEPLVRLTSELNGKHQYEKEYLKKREVLLISFDRIHISFDRSFTSRNSRNFSTWSSNDLSIVSILDRWIFSRSHFVTVEKLSIRSENTHRRFISSHVTFNLSIRNESTKFNVSMATSSVQ